MIPAHELTMLLASLLEDSLLLAREPARPDPIDLSGDGRADAAAARPPRAGEAR